MKPLHVNSWALYQKCMDQAKIRVAVDAGANDGGYSWTLLENGFIVHAFEPVPAMIEKIRERFVLTDKPIYINAMGLSDTRETIKNCSVLEAWTIGHIGQGGLQVKPEMKDAALFDMHTITLDEYLNMTRIGLIKLDVDGYEFKVLKGAQRTIARDKPPILCEFNCYLHKLFGKDEPEKMVNFIFSLGYKVVSCDGMHEFTSWEAIEPQWPWHTSFDVMLVPR
jgi:FkbM family methyltransferase